MTQLIPLADAIPPVGGKPGAPLRKPREVMADRACHDEGRRMTLSGRGVGTAIARRGGPHGSGPGVFRYVVEQFFALFHRFRRLRVRYERRDDTHEALMSFGCCVICWRRLFHTSTGYL